MPNGMTFKWKWKSSCLETLKKQCVFICFFTSTTILLVHWFSRKFEWKRCWANWECTKKKPCPNLVTCRNYQNHSNWKASWMMQQPALWHQLICWCISKWLSRRIMIQSHSSATSRARSEGASICFDFWATKCCVVELTHSNCVSIFLNKKQIWRMKEQKWGQWMCMVKKTWKLVASARHKKKWAGRFLSTRSWNGIWNANKWSHALTKSWLVTLENGLLVRLKMRNWKHGPIFNWKEFEKESCTILIVTTSSKSLE